MRDRPAGLVRDFDVRGRPDTGMTELFAERAGRALGTLARRRGLGDSAFVVGREPGALPARLRDGLVRGLLLSGQDVVDVGVVDARGHEFALVHLARAAGVFVAGADAQDPSSAGLEILLGGGPLVGAALKELEEIIEGGDFAAGAGALTVADVAVAYREAERRGEVPGCGRDTQVI